MLSIIQQSNFSHYNKKIVSKIFCSQITNLNLNPLFFFFKKILNLNPTYNNNKKKKPAGILFKMKQKIIRR